MGPVLGKFEFDLSGRTAAWYSLTVLLVLFLLARRLVHSPFGATLKAIRDNRLRAMAIGIPVASRLVGDLHHRRGAWPAPPARCWRRPPASPRSTCWPSTARPT